MSSFRELATTFNKSFSQSTSQNRIWIALYLTLASALLAGRAVFFSPNPFFSPVPFVSILAVALLIVSILLSVYSIQRPRPWTSLLLLATAILQAFLVTAFTYFSFSDVIVGPLATWSIAVIIALLFAILGRFSTFHEDLVPRISGSWKVCLNAFAGTLLFMNGASLLSFIPDRSLFAATFIKLSNVDGDYRLPVLLDLLFTHFPYDPGVWGYRLLPSQPLTKTKNLLSLIYILSVITILAVWTRKRIVTRNSARFFDSLRIPARLPRPSPQRELELQSTLIFLFSFAGISFLFGLYAPLLYINAGRSLSALRSLNWDLVLLFALFLLGGVGTWASALELAALRGFWFVAGFLSGTVLIYLPTSTLGFLLASFIIPSLTEPELYALRVALQVAVGVVLLFTSFLLTGLAKGPVDILKYTTALALPLVFIGFGAPHAVHRWPFSYLLNPTAQAAVFLALALTVAFLPVAARFWSRTSGRLILALPNHLAAAPLVAGAPWVLDSQSTTSRDYMLPVTTEPPQVDSSVNLGQDPSMLRVFAMESDEEIVKFASRPWYRALANEQKPHVIVTDLLSALIIIYRTRSRLRIKPKSRYRLRFAICGIPWKTVSRHQPSDRSWHISPGYLPYTPTRQEVTYSPIYAGERHLPSGYSGSAFYLLNSPEVAAGILPEPYASFVEFRSSPRGLTLKRADAPDTLESNLGTRSLTEMYAHLPYVVLTRSTLPETLHPGWAYVKNAMFHGIDRLRQDLYVVDVAEVRRIADFLNWSPGPLGPIDLPVLSKALMEADFGTSINPFAYVRQHLRQPLVALMRELNLLTERQNSDPIEWAKDGTMPEWYEQERIDIPLGHRIDESSPISGLLAPLVVVWASNSPGRLREILAAFQPLDLLFADTSNVGAHGLIYLFPKQCLPAIPAAPPSSDYELLAARPLPRTVTEDIARRAYAHQCLVREVRGLLLRVHDEPGGLLKALATLQSDLGTDAPLNIEGLHAFASVDREGLCFLMMEEADLKRVIDAAVAHGRVA